ncbi:neutral zinc metallopeptidase [bacterium]|nr:neutral zinc metallopeptidase [bacterium]
MIVRWRQGRRSENLDDRLQMQLRGYVVPESFNHGTSEQRVRWFRRGFETGDLSQGDTFGARDL